MSVLPPVPSQILPQGDVTPAMRQWMGAMLTDAASDAADIAQLQTDVTDLQTDVTELQSSLIQRNIVPNGSCSVWQRGSSITSNGAIQYTADRYAIIRSAGTQVVSRQAGPAGVAPYCARIERSAADTLTDTMFFVCALETVDCLALAGQEITFSFYLRVGSGWSARSIYGPNLNQMEAKVAYGTGTDAGPFAAFAGEIIAIYFDPTTSWVRYTGTATVPSNATQLKFYIDYSPPSTAGANNYFEVSGIQIELGPRATQFDLPSFGDDLTRCQRYYQKTFDYATAPAQNAGSTGCWTFAATIAGAAVNRINTIPYRQRMRIAPTTTFYNPAAANAFAWNFIRLTSATATAGSGGGESGTGMSVTGIAGWAVNDLCGVHYAADAEL